MSRIPALGPRGEGWVILQVILFVVIAAAGILVPGDFGESAQAVTTALGVTLIVAGGLLGVAGLVGLQGSDALTAVPRPRDESRLTETGAYRLVRHPVYGGLIIGAVGWALLRGSPAALVAAAVLFVVLELKRRLEERWLVSRYPGYAAYRTRTRRLIPWIW